MQKSLPVAGSNACPTKNNLIAPHTASGILPLKKMHQPPPTHIQLTSETPKKIVKKIKREDTKYALPRAPRGPYSGANLRSRPTLLRRTGVMRPVGRHSGLGVRELTKGSDGRLPGDSTWQITMQTPDH